MSPIAPDRSKFTMLTRALAPHPALQECQYGIPYRSVARTAETAWHRVDFRFMLHAMLKVLKPKCYISSAEGMDSGVRAGEQL